ncbi:MAG TPA: hypothetical protein VF857_09205 [Spirochaetota bacterium]
MKKVIPDIILEQYILGELPKGADPEIINIIETDPTVIRRINEIRESNAEILAQYPAPYIAGQITASLKSHKPINKKKRFYFAPLPVLGAIATAVVVIFYFPMNVYQPNQSHLLTQPSTDEAMRNGDKIRSKGLESSLGIFRKTESEPEQLSDGSIAHEGDVLQIVYQSQRQYGVILSIDGRGNVTLHYPNTGWDSSKIEKGKKVYLEKSYQLDNAPAFERFFFITSDVGISTDFILTRARSLAKDISRAEKDFLSIPGTKETAMLLKKE